MSLERDPRIRAARRGLAFSWIFYSLFLLAVLAVAATAGSEPLLFGLPRWVALACFLLPAGFVAALVPLVEKLIPDVPLDDDRDRTS